MRDKILIVDDEPSNRNILGQELTQKGYSVVTASDGREALRKVESSRPDLIMLDYMILLKNPYGFFRFLGFGCWRMSQSL